MQPMTKEWDFNGVRMRGGNVYTLQLTPPE